MKNIKKAEQCEFGEYNSKGEWRPPYPVKYAPLFETPQKIGVILKWLLGWPGYIWPWHLLFFGVTAATWYWFQPSLEQCRTFNVDWILYMFIRNEILIWMVCGAWHLVLYILKLQGTKQKYDPRWQNKGNKKFLFKNQVLDNIFWTCCSAVPFWTAYEVLFMWAYANGKIPFLEWAMHPVWFVAWFFLIPVWREFHFYWVHRFLHWKPMFKRYHSLHHLNVNPGPWAGLAMHPVECFGYFSVIMIHWIIPSHPLHMLFNAQLTALTPAGGHHGFEGPILNGKVPTGSYFHYLHHRYYRYNFGECLIPFDKWFGTFHDGSFDTDPSRPWQDIKNK
ncbi:sterol desaturase family protein [Pontiella agarivorans]|nr:sterol desaturase family protein [Pontiella agarivorans]